jgi:hypothetical protein
MSWSLSAFRKGALVEVRSKEEMPEMLRYCGQRFRVAAVAHKTCETAHKTYKGRRLQTGTVHLEGLTCSGAAHGGCEAECNLFWKDEWLKPVDDARSSAEPSRSGSGCSESQLLASAVQTPATESEEIRYSCQATRVYEATVPLAWWDVRQYIFDFTTGNHSAGYVLGVLFLAWLRWLLLRVPFGFNAFKRFHDHMHLRLSGRASPSLNPGIPDGAPTPIETLGVQAGDYVRIKPQAQIEATIRSDGKNRGLSFDPQEMAPYCGQVVRVRRRVNRILDEVSGRMTEMKQPCITLTGVVCRSRYASCRLNCPRAFPSYWREIWLERVPPGEVPDKRQAAATSLSGGSHPPA